MTHYIDGFVLPVPRDQLKTYREVVEKVAEIWKEHGALDYSEYVGDDSNLIVVGSKAQKNAISAENNAVSEVTYNDEVDTVRAKKYVRVKGRLYLVGIECRCKERTSK